MIDCHPNNTIKTILVNSLSAPLWLIELAILATSLSPCVQAMAGVVKCRHHDAAIMIMKRYAAIPTGRLRFGGSSNYSSPGKGPNSEEKELEEGVALQEL